MELIGRILTRFLQVKIQFGNASICIAWRRVSAGWIGPGELADMV